MPTGKRGFSLLEMLVVIAVLATLVALAIPYYQDYAEEARLAALKNNLHQLRKALIDCWADNKELPPVGNLKWLVDGVGPAKNRYFQILPEDPTTGAADWYYDPWDPVNGRFNASSSNAVYSQY